MREIEKLVNKHDKWRLEECINLIPSENVTSPKVRQLLTSDLGHRYTLRKKECPDFPMPFDNFYCGTTYIDKIEEIGTELACKVFDSKHAFLQSLSGHLSCMIMLVSFCSKDDRILAIDSNYGYPGYHRDFTPDYFGINSDVLPFNDNEFDLDYEKCEEKILEFKPKLVVLGASYILFPYNIKRIRKICNEVNAYIGYDASHVLGLIAGKEFQQPLKEGVDIMIGSTHKSFFGPQGGIILTNDDEIAKKVLRNMKLKMLDNPHPNRIAALSLSLWEFLKFGKHYAKNVVKNAQALGKSLMKNDVPIKYKEKNFTKSHQILVDKESLERVINSKYSSLAEKLEKANIIVDRGGRIGTQEVTRFGMGKKQMENIANFFSQIVYSKDSLIKIKRKIIRVRKQFLEIKYCN